MKSISEGKDRKFTLDSLEEMVTKRFSFKRLESTTTFHEEDRKSIEFLITAIMKSRANDNWRERQHLTDIICRAKNKDTFEYLVDLVEQSDKDFAEEIICKYVGIKASVPETVEEYFSEASKLSPAAASYGAQPRKPKIEDLYVDILKQIPYQKDHPNFRKRRLERCLEMAHKFGDRKLIGRIETVITLEREARVFDDIENGRFVDIRLDGKQIFGMKKGSENVREGAMKKAYKNFFLISTEHQIDRLPKLTEGGRKTFERLTKGCRDGESFERHIKYILNTRGGGEVDLVKEIIKNYTTETLSKYPLFDNDGEKLQRGFAIATELGDKELTEYMIKASIKYCTLHGGISPLLSYSHDVHVGQEIKHTSNEGHKIVFNKFKDGKSILHYTCMSGNAELIKEIADIMHAANPAENPFDELDGRQGREVNRLKPKHYLTPSVAEKLDRLYNIDGSGQGSFSSSVRFYNEAGKVTKQEFLGYLGAVAKHNPKATFAGGLVGKIVAGIAVASVSNSIDAIHNKLQREEASDLSVNGGGAIGLLSFAAIAAMASQGFSRLKATLSGANSKEVNPYAPSPRKSVQSSDITPRTTKYMSSTLENNDNKALLDALTPKKSRRPNIDLDRAYQIVSNGDFKDVSDEVLAALKQCCYFPDDALKREIYKNLVKKASPEQFEGLMRQLAASSPESLVIAREITAAMISAETSDEMLKRATLISAMLGDEATFSKAKDKLVTRYSGFSLLDLGGRDDMNLMHYATRSGNSTLMRVVMGDLERDAAVYPTYCKTQLNAALKEYDKTSIFSRSKLKLLRAEIQHFERRLRRDVLDIPDTHGLSAKAQIIQDREVATHFDEALGIDPNSERGFAMAHVDKKFDDAVRHRVKLGLAFAGKFISTTMLVGSITAALVAMEGMNIVVRGAAEAIMSVSALGIGVAAGYSSDSLLYGTKSIFSRVADWWKGTKPAEQLAATSKDQQKFMADKMKEVMTKLGDELKSKASTITSVDDLVKLVESTTAYDDIGLSKRDKQRVVSTLIRNLEDVGKFDSRASGDPAKVLDVMKGMLIASGFDQDQVGLAQAKKALARVKRSNSPLFMVEESSSLNQATKDQKEIKAALRARTLTGRVKGMYQEAAKLLGGRKAAISASKGASDEATGTFKSKKVAHTEHPSALKTREF